MLAGQALDYVNEVLNIYFIILHAWALGQLSLIGINSSHLCLISWQLKQRKPRPPTLSNVMSLYLGTYVMYVLLE